MSDSTNLDNRHAPGGTAEDASLQSSALAGRFVARTNISLIRVATQLLLGHDNPQWGSQRTAFNGRWKAARTDLDRATAAAGFVEGALQAGEISVDRTSGAESVSMSDRDALRLKIWTTASVRRGPELRAFMADLTQTLNPSATTVQKYFGEASDSQFQK